MEIRISAKQENQYMYKIPGVLNFGFSNHNNSSNFNLMCNIKIIRQWLKILVKRNINQIIFFIIITYAYLHGFEKCNKMRRSLVPDRNKIPYFSMDTICCRFISK